MNCFSAHALAAFYADALAASPPRSELFLPFFIATCALIIAGYALRHALVDVNDNNNTIAKAAIPACLQAASSLDVETRAVWDDVTKLYNDEIATPSPYNLATSTGNWCEAHRLRATGEDAKWGALLEESMRIRHVEEVHRQGVKMRCKTVIADYTLRHALDNRLDRNSKVRRRQGMTIAEIAATNSNFSTLLAAATAAGFQDVLTGEELMTIFGTGEYYCLFCPLFRFCIVAFP